MVAIVIGAGFRVSQLDEEVRNWTSSPVAERVKLAAEAQVDVLLFVYF
jgi:hypothetical protein